MKTFQRHTVALEELSGDVPLKQDAQSTVISDVISQNADTGTGSIQDSLFRSAVSTSRTIDELRALPVYGRLWQPAPKDEDDDPVVRAGNHRVALLSKSFEGNTLSREDEARVAILTARLHSLVPRVSQKCWTIAEESVDKIERISDRVNELSRKYGL